MNVFNIKLSTRIHISMVLALFTLSACTSVPTPAPEQTSAPKEQYPLIENSHSDSILTEVSKLSITEPVKPEVLSVPEIEFASEQNGLWSRLEEGFNFPDIDDEIYQSYLNRLLSRPYLVANQIESALPYLDYVLTQVEERGMPTELALLPYVESGYQLDAKSGSGAAGAWQIMPATARHLNIEVNWWNDKRLNLYNSTQAALDYLQHLYEKYENWNLVLIAYNAGPARLDRALRGKNPSAHDDFTQLGLPRETLQYVPKLHAYRDAVVQFSQPDSPVKLESDYVPLQAVIIDQQIDLKVLASLSDLSLEEILALNPGYQRWATGPKGVHEFVLPIEQAQQLESNIAELEPDQYMPWAYYTIRAGDTLGEIARQFDLPVNELKRLNQLKTSRIIAGRKLKIPQQNSIRVAQLSGDSKTQTHTVSAGDSLWRIARRYGLTVRVLALLNKRSPNQPLFPGEELRVSQ